MAKLEVIWSNHAANQLDIIFQYLVIESSRKVANSYVLDLLKTTQNLSEFPNSGKLEPQLLDESKKYKYIINKHIKIIYYINNQTNEIRIVDLFDTRQNPEKITRAIKE